MPCNDSELMQRAASGDVEAITLLYDRYERSLYRVLIGILGSASDTEDAVQEIFLRIACGRTRQVRDARSYLFAAARHEAYNVLRRRHREQSIEETDLAETVIEGTAHDHGVTPAPAGPDIIGLLQRLPLEQREVVALKVYEEMTFAQIAKIVQASPGTVASRYRYGIDKMRAWLQEEDEHEN